ncbi:MAG: hypothetical protein Q9169_006964 [Polycauliona sp. 2 TL-2023]
MTAIAAVSLWDRAVSSLSDEDKQSFDFCQTDKSKILAGVLQATERKKQLCLQRRWKYTRKNGDVVILRDLCDKAITWVQKFKEIGDVAVQYDPTHASLPWAAVRFFLQISVNDVQILGAMLEGLETIAGEITRCHLYELYLSRPSFARTDLDSHLLRHYAGILTYLATAKRYYTKSTIRRLGASVFETFDSVDACLSKIAEGRRQVERCARLIDSELLRGIDSINTKTQASVDALADDLKSLTTTMSISQDVQYQSLKTMMVSINQPILRTAAQISDIDNILKKEDRRKVLVWLSNVRYREHHKVSFAAVMPGSGAWLQQKPKFIHWKTSSTSSILWIRGIPGSGKTKLMSTVIQSLLDDKNRNTATSAFAYFYCTRDPAEKARADPDEIMRAVLKQVSCFDTSQPIHIAVSSEFQKRHLEADEDGLAPSKLSLLECKNLILEIADQLPLVMVIDALDECDSLKRHELLGALKDIVQKSNSLIKIIVSSRNDPDIVCRLSSVPNVYIKSDDNSQDIDMFVELEIDKAIDEQRLLQGLVPSSLRERIIIKLRDRANGMFLWARLQIESLCDPERMRIAGDVEDALDHLPTTLFDIYSDILGRINRIAPHGRLLAMKTIRWLLCARMPLNSPILLPVLQSSHNEYPLLIQEVLGLCCNLVVLDDSLNVFRFAHLSIREYLESHPEFTSQDNNLEAAQDCLQFALQGQRDHYVADFEEYASVFWMGHYRALDYDYRITQSVATKMKSFFLQGMEGGNQWKCWAKRARKRYLHDSFVESPLHEAFAWGLVEVMEALLCTKGIEVDLEDSAGNTCLWKAASSGHSDIVKLLLMSNADTNIVDSCQSRTALHMAIAFGREENALLLLQNNADVGIQDSSGRTALNQAVQSDQEAMVRLLVFNGCHYEAKQRYGQILIDWAMKKESSKVQYDAPKIFHRVTGCVGIKNDGWGGSLNAIVHLLFSLLPYHESMSHNLVDENQITLSNGMKRLFTEMETSTAVVLNDVFILPPEQRSRLNSTRYNGLSSPFDIMQLLFDTSEGEISWRGPLAIHRAFGSQAMWCFRMDIRGYINFEQALRSLGVRKGKDASLYEFPWLQSTRFPPVMMFELQRYFEMFTTSSGKRHDYFAYPASLARDDLTTCEQITYILHGVIVHRGDNFIHSDVFIYIKSHNTGHWIRCQDETVTWASEDEVFEKNYGSGTSPENLDPSCTAIGLIYIQEDKIGDIAKVMVPYGE